MTKHWSKVQYLHQVVQNANIHIKGTHSYYSDCWDNGFEQSVVRYLLGDEISKQWQPRWEVDQLYIGDFNGWQPQSSNRLVLLVSVS